MLILSGVKAQTVKHEKYGEQKVITLGLSNGKCPPFNVMFEGKPQIARLVPMPDANGVWHLKLVMNEAQGVAEEPKAEKPKKTFKTAEVEKTSTESSRLDKLEAGMAQILAALSKA